MKEYKTLEQKKKFYNSAAWTGKNGIRHQALKRDNYECQECKKLGDIHLDSEKNEGERKSIELNVHHIKEVEDYPELALQLENTVTLCLYHHNVVHGRVPNDDKARWMDEKW